MAAMRVAGVPLAAMANLKEANQDFAQRDFVIGKYRATCYRKSALTMLALPLLASTNPIGNMAFTALRTDDLVEII